ncbi:50S ribosomal protein L33 [Candidatus Wolfebacteria bacterium RIFCSPLOWO2_01_FULL_45_19]|uniref:Large ribosomal subunit protein bL33 n=1 Tax=Candidatus Wolfebacteria bacterium RIFCSPLOWO2_01_FULL_45_19 TaxID=1802557 RepID=A0A1F8DSJ3_9BACT|nr:MAG: 50S ribosomal protein L33 [Candidatus Wolfebacteria bacterium RIFCSPLOWO2_01_FULL_45_19]
MAKIKTSERFVRLRCAECKRVNYNAHKNKKKVERKIELSKFCDWCRKHTAHKEARK